MTQANERAFEGYVEEILHQRGKGTPLNNSVNMKRDCFLKKGLCRSEGTLVPRQLTMETVGILQGEGFGKLFQNQRPLLHGTISP